MLDYVMMVLYCASGLVLRCMMVLRSLPNREPRVTAGLLYPALTALSHPSRISQPLHNAYSLI